MGIFRDTSIKSSTEHTANTYGILSAVEFVFISMIVLHLSLSYSLIISERARDVTDGVVYAYTEVQTDFHKYIAQIIPEYRTKRIRVQDYDETFYVETDAQTFGELAVLLPLKVEEEYLIQLYDLPLVDGMEVIIPTGQYQTGIASWYGYYFQGLLTASTELYNVNKLTAAHKELPLGTVVKVTNLENRKSVVVRINDRGPYVGERVIDLSREAARQIGILEDGLAWVSVEIIEE